MRPSVEWLAAWWQWRRFWLATSHERAPRPVIEGGWPLVRYTFRPPVRWRRHDLDAWAERLAMQLGAHWFDHGPAGPGLWFVQLDCTDWSASPPPGLTRCDGAFSVPLGVYPDAPAVWTLGAAPHLLIAGQTGAGKSTLLRSLVAALPLGWCWRILVVDPKEVEFHRFASAMEIVGMEGVPSLVDDLTAILVRRKEQLVAEGVDHWTDLAPSLIPVRPILLVLDEAVDVFEGAGLGKATATAVRERLGTVLRQGRALGIHVVAAFTRPDADSIPGALRDQFGARIGLGNLSPEAHRMMFGADAAQRLPALVGTGLARGLDGSSVLRRFRSSAAMPADVMARHCPWLTRAAAG